LSEDGEDDAQLLARVEQEARNIMGSYTHAEHKARVASLLNNGHLNCIVEVAGVSYGPRPVPVSAEVLKKRKVDAAAKVFGKHLKVTEKKSAMPVKVSGSRVSVGSKRPSSASKVYKVEQVYRSARDCFSNRGVRYVGSTHLRSRNWRWRC
jgi:hypothetical protein